MSPLAVSGRLQSAISKLGSYDPLFRVWATVAVKGNYGFGEAPEFGL
jgi:hypothetical protein